MKIYLNITYFWKEVHTCEISKYIILGDEGCIAKNGSEVFNSFDKSIFQQAKNMGINRTVHAGEDGPSDNVKIAVEEMFAQRIGHGYRVNKY